MSNNGKVHDRVAILDAGAQYGKVIDRKARELCVETEVLPLNVTPAELREKGFRAVIISGGPGSVYAEDAPRCDEELFNSGFPILGICYGMQLMNMEFGGSVERKGTREDGQFEIDVDPTCALFNGLQPKQAVLMSHGDSVDQVASPFRSVAHSGPIVAGIAHRTLPLYGVQFHPEVDLSENGVQMMKNFLFNIACLEGNYTMASREQACIKEIQEVVGDSKVLVLVSGGVDSAVCAALLRKSLRPEQVVAVHIDNGFMRLGESEKVQKSLARLDLQLTVVRAGHTFYNATTHITDIIPAQTGGQERQVRHLTERLNCTFAPEEKRKIIGDTFVHVAEEILKDLNLDVENVILAQGTLRPDLIESASTIASGKAEAIKTHHNDTELVRELRRKGRVIEPLRDFHKDEVRALGRELGLPDDLVERHPFPGPGLAIRILCTFTPFICNQFNRTNTLLSTIVDFTNASKKKVPPSTLQHILSTTSEDEQGMLRRITSQSNISATLLPVKTVGVQGDCRTYSYVAALSSNDAPNWRFNMWLAKLIPRICHNVNRVVHVFGKQVEGPITTVTPTLLTPGIISLLRHADNRAQTVLHESGLARNISQMPIVLVPVHFDRNPDRLAFEPSCQHSVAIRTFITSDFMTGVPATPGRQLPEAVLGKMVSQIEALPGISRVMFDLTAKPPGTTEWE